MQKKSTFVVLLMVGMMLLGSVSVLSEDARLPDSQVNNPYGVQLLAGHRKSIQVMNRWAKHLIGEWGYIKGYFYDITSETQGASSELVYFVQKAYENHMIPVIRLEGQAKGGYGIKPEPDSDGSYGPLAQAVKRVVKDLPRIKGIPVYIEVWNEPNLRIGWSGEYPEPAEYAKMFVDISKAIKDIGDPEIYVMNGALAPGGDYDNLQFIKDAINAVPEFGTAFDVWATHPYSGAPPEYNHHNQNARDSKMCIDSYVLELETLEACGVDTSELKVMITETSWYLGQGGGEFPVITRDVRADYFFRAFRDYWSVWSEVLGVTPYFLANEFAANDPFTWVYGGSGSRQGDGYPNQPYEEYIWVEMLAKPYDTTGTLSGKVFNEANLSNIEEAIVQLDPGGIEFSTSTTGNYIFSDLAPGIYTITVDMDDFEKIVIDSLQVVAGENIVVDVPMISTAFGSIQGTVVDNATGQGLEGITITIVPGDLQVVTDNKGVYKVDGLTPGLYTIVADIDGYYPHEKAKLRIRAWDELVENFYLGKGEYACLNGGNALGNPSLEIRTQKISRSLPPPWGTTAEAKEGFMWVDPGTKYSGEASLKIDAAPGRVQTAVQWSNYSYTQPGVRYNAQVWIKTQGVVTTEEQNGVYLSVTNTTDYLEKRLYVESEIKLKGDNDWTLVELEFEGATIGRTIFELNVDAEAGSAWFDNACLSSIGM